MNVAPIQSHYGKNKGQDRVATPTPPCSREKQTQRTLGYKKTQVPAVDSFVILRGICGPGADPRQSLPSTKGSWPPSFKDPGSQLLLLTQYLQCRAERAISCSHKYLLQDRMKTVPGDKPGWLGESPETPKRSPQDCMEWRVNLCQLFDWRHYFFLQGYTQSCMFLRQGTQNLGLSLARGASVLTYIDWLSGAC